MIYNIILKLNMADRERIMGLAKRVSFYRLFLRLFHYVMLNRAKTGKYAEILYISHIQRVIIWKFQFDS